MIMMIFKLIIIIMIMIIIMLIIMIIIIIVMSVGYLSGQWSVKKCDFNV